MQCVEKLTEKVWCKCRDVSFCVSCAVQVTCRGVGCSKPVNAAERECSKCRGKRLKECKEKKKEETETLKSKNLKRNREEEDDQQLLQRADKVALALQLDLPVATRKKARADNEIIREELRLMNERVNEEVRKESAMLIVSVQTLQQKKRKRIEM